MLFAFASACTTAPETNQLNNEPGSTDVIICEQPRPQVCTREYNPVCATLDDGQIKTYATGCTSCADVNVQSYTPGACASDAETSSLSRF